MRASARWIPIFSVSLAVALGMALGLAYADMSSGEFDLPVTATVTLKISSPQTQSDVNKDGKVDADDLAIVARSLAGSQDGDLTADVNGDGLVDVRDLAFVALHFGEVSDTA